MPIPSYVTEEVDIAFILDYKFHLPIFILPTYLGLYTLKIEQLL